MGVSMADSCWCLTENNKILYSNYPSIKTCINWQKQKQTNKKPPCSAWDAGVMGFTPGLGRCPAMPHGRRARQSTKVFSPGESHGQRHLAGYGPWVHSQTQPKQWACMHTSFVIAVLPRIKCFNFMAAITIHSDFGASKIKCVRASTSPLLFSVKWQE